jgi:hypothetical protein
MRADASGAQPAMPARPQHLQPHATSDAHRPAAAARPVGRNRPLSIGCAARAMRAATGGCDHRRVNCDTCKPPAASYGPLQPSIAPARQSRRRSTRTHLVRVPPQPILTRAGADRRAARAFATRSSARPGRAPRLCTTPPPPSAVGAACADGGGGLAPTGIQPSHAHTPPLPTPHSSCSTHVAADPRPPRHRSGRHVTGRPRRIASHRKTTPPPPPSGGVTTRV